MIHSSSKPNITGMESRPQQCGAVTSSSVWYRFSQCLLLLLAICYVLQVASPLRINSDAIILLSTGDSAAHGSNIFFGEQKTLFPPGYPLLLDILMRMGLAHSWAIIALNLVFLSVGLHAANSLLILDFFKDKTVVLLICSFFLLSWVVVKHFTIPLTDVPYFGCSMCSLALMSQATKANGSKRFVTLAVLACILVVAALFIRRVGVALLPPLVFMVAYSPQFKLVLKRISSRAKLIIVAIFTIACIGIALVVVKTSTLVDFTACVRNVRVSALVLRILRYRLLECGSLVSNCPFLKMPVYLQKFTQWIGSILFIFVFVGLATRRREIGTSEVYFVSYMVILFVWPYRDERFWLPVIPFLIAYFVLAVERFKIPKVIVRTYCIYFAILGICAIAYSTRISFAGSAFPDRYGDGSLRSTYCSAFEICGDGGDPKDVNAEALRLIRDYK